MATWMGHLRVAEKLLAYFPDLDPGQFAYGSLAPDLGKPLDDGKFYPPKGVSHLMIRVDDASVFQDLFSPKRFSPYPPPLGDRDLGGLSIHPDGIGARPRRWR